MKSIFQKPNVSQAHGRNGFDESQRVLYSCCVGQLLPTYSDFCSAGDVYKIRAITKIRTEAVQTAAFTRFVLHNDYFFVPMRQIYQFWNEFYNQTFDAHTNFVEPSDIFSFPTFNITKALNASHSLTYYGTNNTSTKKFNLNVDEFGVPRLWNFRRLFSMLGYGYVDYYADSSSSFPTNCLIKFLAYHRIFYSHYNVSDWFVDNPLYYNVDKWHGQNLDLGSGGLNDAFKCEIISKIHYRPWRKDYFNNLYPTPTFSSAFGNYLTESYIDSNNLRRLVNPEYSNGLSGLGQAVESGAYLDYDGGGVPIEEINSADIRSVFALDKLLRVTALAGSHYDEQVYAHLGVKIPEGLAREAYFIGSESVDVPISEVVATSTTNYDSSDPGTSIGDIAGKAFGASNGKPINFKCPEDGVIMCLTSVEPMLDYSSMSIDALNLYKNPFDFFHPEFDNLGMQPFDNRLLSGDLNGSLNVVGWCPRYSELKTKYDVVHESIFDSDKSFWQTNFQSSVWENGYKTFDKNARFYIFPQYTNSIFAAATPHYTSNTAVYTYKDDSDLGFNNAFNKSNNVYAGDNFLVCINFEAYKTSIMSVHSIPKIS